MKVDESQESAGLLGIERDEGLAVGPDRRLRCPRDGGAMMMRHFFSAKRQVVVDECPSCGYWLDPATIRTEFASEEEREQAARRYFSVLFEAEIAAAHRETEEDLARAQRVARILRFICPSYYIPGRQEWGAF